MQIKIIKNKRESLIKTIKLIKPSKIEYSKINEYNIRTVK